MLCELFHNHKFRQAIRVRDVTCLFSMHRTTTEIAYLCPSQKMNWFLSNMMPQCNVNSSLDPRNLMNDYTFAMLLKSDLHSAFNERQFVQTSRRFSQNTMRIQASASHRIKLDNHANV